MPAAKVQEFLTSVMEDGGRGGLRLQLVASKPLLALVAGPLASRQAGLPR
jgi:hypothetical protein